MFANLIGGKEYLVTLIYSSLIMSEGEQLLICLLLFEFLFLGTASSGPLPVFLLGCYISLIDLYIFLAWHLQIFSLIIRL